jgi:hypothetical protein
MAYQLKECIRDENTTYVPPSNGLISNLEFFPKYFSIDFVNIRNIYRTTNENKIQINNECEDDNQNRDRKHSCPTYAGERKENTW